MAMLISKFHRLIQSRLLWIAFLVIVVFTFVIWGTTMPSANTQDVEANSPGRLNGEPVSREDFYAAKNNSYLAVMMAMGREFKITEEIDAQLEQAAWYRIASLAEARKLGLTASREEIANAIQSNPAFAVESGQFSKQGYKAFVQQFLGPRGFTEINFEHHVGEEILLQKLRYIIGRSVLVPPVEMKRTFSAISDRFKIDYVELGPELVRKDVKVGDAEARAYFDKDPSMFELPEKVKVKYVRFAVAPFIPKAKAEPEQIQSYYDENMDEFLRPTNEIAATTNALGTNALFTSKYKPFEDVKQDIANRIIARTAIDLAADRAMDLVLKLTPDRTGKALTFEEAAKEFGVGIEKAGPVAERDTIDGIDAGREFARAAFALSNDPEGYFTDPIRGKDYVYVAALEERVPKRIPSFEEVKKEVLPLAEAQALSDALGNKAREIREAAVKAVKAGQTFASALAPFALKPQTSDFFTASSGPTTNEYGALLMRGVMPLNQGEVSEILSAPQAVYLAHVVARQPGDPTTYDSLRQQIEMSLRRQTARLVFDGWQQDLLRRGGFEERKPVASEEADSELDEDEAAADEQTT